VKYCPAANCPFALRHKRAAEYTDDAVRCSDCNTALADGPAPPRVVRAREKTTRRAPWRRLLVTLAVPAAMWGVQQISLPGIDFDQSMMRYFRDVPRSLASILSLGIVPFLSAAVLVELAALIVPGWRTMRIDPDDRRRLGRATMIVGVLLAAIQAFLIARQLEYLAREPGLAFRTTCAITLVAASCVLVLLAWLVDRHGLGNGFSIVIVAALGPSLWDLGRALVYGVYGETLAPVAIVLLVGTLGFLVVATIMVLDAHRGWLAFLRGPGPKRPALRLPASGTAPLELAATILLLPATLASYTGFGADVAMKIVPGTRVYLFAELALLVAGTALFAWLFNRGAEPALRAQLPSAWLRSTLYLALLVLGMAFLTHSVHIAVPLGAILLAVGTAVALDLVREWRAFGEHPDLVAVWPIHRIYTLDSALATLERASIYVHPRGAHHRTLLQFFGPYVPITLMVPAPSADEARRVLSSWAQAA
jgi:preprotein translocase subunit SecY